MAISKETKQAYQENARRVKKEAKVSNNTKTKIKKPQTALDKARLQGQQFKNEVAKRKESERRYDRQLALKEQRRKQPFQEQMWNEQIQQQKNKNERDRLTNERNKQKMEFEKENQENKRSDRAKQAEKEKQSDLEKAEQKKTTQRNKIINATLGNISSAIDNLKSQFVYRSSKRFFGR